VKRIEIIRGPSSSLYGSDGMFATINVVTISPEEFSGTQVRAKTGTLGEKKLQAASSMALSHGATLLLSGALFNDAGEHSIYIPRENSPVTNFGRAIDMDGEKGYHLFANLTWRDWSILAVFDARPKIQPVSWGPTVFNDSGTRAIDSRNFTDATYTHKFDESGACSGECTTTITASGASSAIRQQPILPTIAISSTETGWAHS
jgi:outer membrane receptor for ferrienterochelin and colicins